MTQGAKERKKLMREPKRYGTISKKSSVPAIGILAKGASVWRDRQAESEETVEVTIDKNLLKQ